jgi:NAD(P)-dependent dehydrogenase (short-subunit alcohol dehydrogenase family)
MRLKDKVAIITGAGTGIGRASAILFAREGARVVVCGRREIKLKETVELIKNEGNEASYYCADVKEEDQVMGLIEDTCEKYGKIDILFNNAGVGYSAPYVMDSVVKTPARDFDEVLAINLRSVFLCSKYAIPHMIGNGGGAILNCSSINGVIGCGADAYTASKGGINALSRSMAVDNARYNIRVNVVSPSATDTPMIQSAYEQDGFYEYWSQAGPIKRMATAEDVAYAALFLVSDEASYITGQNLMVDGGLSIS